LRWQYSLRSNLLLWGCLQSAYLLSRLDEIPFVLGAFAGVALLNVATDQVYRYPEAPLYEKAKRGHVAAFVVIWTVAIAYYFLLPSA